MTDERSVTIGYTSARRLCALAEGFIAGAARHFGEQVEIDHPVCMLEDADHCVIACRFGPADADVVGAN